MMSDGSDIEIQAAKPMKTTKKMPRSPSEDILKNSEPRKMTTKEMIHDALLVLKHRKGVSLQAIKKYLKEKYSVDIEKNNYIIKKNIKNGVENGSIVQMKGVGASGSFKLVEKKPEKKKKKPVDSEKTKKIKKPSEKSKKPKTADEKTGKKTVKLIEKVVEKKTTKKTEATKPKKPKSNQKEEKKEEKKKENKTAKVLKTPAKKKAIMMKRKSIGSIIKPPKMKPKATKAKA